MMERETPMTASEQLRAHTEEFHALVESLPFFEALASGKLDRAQYASHLGAQLIVFEALAGRCESIGQKEIARARSARLRRDLEALRQGALNEEIAQAARDYAERLSETTQAQIWGHLYVWQGSVMGGVVIARAVHKAYDLSPGQPGALFYEGNGQETASRWRAFKRQLDERLGSHKAIQQAIEGAREAFSFVEDLGRAHETVRGGQPLRATGTLT